MAVTNLTDSLDTERFAHATEKGEVTEQSGYHQPRSGRRFTPNCGCSLTTEKGAYRDVTVSMPDGRTIHYYHQSPVVVVKDGRYRLDSHGYQTSTTKERINRYTPAGYSVLQRDFTWYLSTPDGREEFEDGMVIDLTE